MKDFFYSFGKAMRSIIAFISTLLIFGIVFLLMLKRVPDENQTLAYFSLGLLLGCYKDITGYYFGSSKDKSDRDKADIIEDLNAKP